MILILPSRLFIGPKSIDAVLILNRSELSFASFNSPGKLFFPLADEHVEFSLELLLLFLNNLNYFDLLFIIDKFEFFLNFICLNMIRR